MRLLDYKHIAIVQTAFIGDVVLALPLAQAIREVAPHSKLTFVTTPAGASLAQCSPAIDTIVVYDKRSENKGWTGIHTMAHSLRTVSVQCIIAPHRSLRTTLLTRLARPDCSIGFTKNALSRLYTQRVPYPYHLHEKERNIHLLSVFTDIPPAMFLSAPLPRIVVPEPSKQYVNRLLVDAEIRDDKPIAVLAPGSVWATKRWPVERFQAVARALQADGFQVLLSGSRDDIPLCNYVAENAGAISLAGKTSLPETLALFAKASIAISNDSAPTHIANLVNCPVITIFGPTTSVLGFAPRGAEDRIVEQEKLACRPCAIHGQQECPLGHFACMRDIEPERVIRLVEDIVSHKQWN